MSPPGPAAAGRRRRIPAVYAAAPAVSAPSAPDPFGPLRDRIARLRRRDGGRSGPIGDFLRFVRAAAGKVRHDALAVQSAALAFITLVSLIPLLAVFSHYGASQVVELVGRLLPYSDPALLGTLQRFLENASGIGFFGFLVFLATSLAAFATVESTINRVWNVAARRPFRTRLVSFILFVFFGALAVPASYSLDAFLRQVYPFQAVDWSLTLQLLPPAVTLVALTTVYWLVPYTTVHFWSAWIGALCATGMVEALRRGFGLYIDSADNISLVYGSFGFALFFVVSVQATWWIVLVGSEVAFAVQHYASMSRRRVPAVPLDGGWIGVAALAIIAERFVAGEPITRHEDLADRLRLSAFDLRQALAPLLDAGILGETGADDEGYLLAAEPRVTPIDTVLALYEPGHETLAEGLSGATAASLRTFRERTVEARDGQWRGVTLGDLVAGGAALRSERPARPRQSGRAAPPRDRRSGR